MTTRAWSLAFLIGASVAVGAGPSTAAAPPHVQAYNIIKGIENSFPIPTPETQVIVGAFDASTGQWTGLTSTFITTFPPPLHKPVRTAIPPVAQINAVAVTLRFTAQFGPVTFTVTPIFGADGPGATITKTIPIFQSATFDVGRASRVNWTATSGGFTYSDAVILARPKIVGAGAFTIPALPVALVYEPPTTPGGITSQTYTIEHSVGTAIRTEISQENSTTRPGTVPKYDGILGLKSQLSAVAALLNTGGAQLPEKDKAKKAEVVSALGGIGSALDLIASGLGSAGSTDTTGSIKTEVSQQELKVTMKRTVTPISNLGPGRGDVIVVLINARMVWLAEDGRVTLSLLGFDGTGTFSIEILRTQPGAVPIDPGTIQELLKLDPFVTSGPVAAPPSPRFTFEGFESIGGAKNTMSLTHQVTQTDLTASTNYSIHTEDYRAGFLSFLGIGVDETKQVMAKMTHSNSTAVSVGTTTSAEITFASADVANFNVYFDRIFNTFAVTKRIIRPFPGNIFVPINGGVLAR